jgi:hypothetical protein
VRFEERRRAYCSRRCIDLARISPEQGKQEGAQQATHHRGLTIHATAKATNPNADPVEAMAMARYNCSVMAWRSDELRKIGNARDATELEKFYLPGLVGF